MKNKFNGSTEKGFHSIQKVKIILSGLRFAMVDTTVSYKIVLSVLVIVPSLFLHQWLDTSIIILATAIEAVCDYMQSEFDPKIWIIKDVSAAATSIAILTWLIVLAVEAYELFFNISL